MTTKLHAAPAILAAENDALAKANEGQLQKLEKVIQKGEDAFFAASRAVVQIVDAELFKPWHSDKTSYFRDRWDMTPQNLTRFENAGRVLAGLEAAELKLPKNEGQCRELFRQTEGDDSKIVTLWQSVLDSGEKPTAKLIGEKAKNLFPNSTSSAAKTSEEQQQDTIVEHKCSAKVVIAADGAVVKDALEYQGRPCEQVAKNKWSFEVSAKDRSALIHELASWNRVYEVAEITIRFE